MDLASSSQKMTAVEIKNTVDVQNVKLVDEPGSANIRVPYEQRSRSMPLMKSPFESNPAGTVEAASPPVKGKGRRDLRLPCFKALGIAVPHPDHLLTPPEEPDQISWHPHSQPLPHLQDFDIPRSIPSYLASMTPEDDQPIAAEGDQTVVAPHDSEGLASDNNTSTVSAALEVVQEESELRPTSSSSEEDSPGGPTWLEHAIDAVGMSRAASRLVAYSSTHS